MSVIHNRIIRAIDGDDITLAAVYLSHLRARPAFICPVCECNNYVYKRKLQSTIAYIVCNACGLKASKIRRDRPYKSRLRRSRTIV